MDARAKTITSIMSFTRFSCIKKNYEEAIMILDPTIKEPVDVYGATIFTLLYLKPIWRKLGTKL